jgi:hypothetical protein
MKFVRLLFGCFALVVAFGAHAWKQPEMARYGAVYSGPELLTVHVAHTKDDKNAVIMIQGINHPFDGQIFFMKVRYWQATSGVRTRIVYEYPQNDNMFLRLEADSSGTLFLPNYRGLVSATLDLKYEQADSANLSPNKLVENYARQLESKK